MSLSRRAFVRTIGVGGATLLARPWPSRVWGSDPEELLAMQQAGARPILLHNNENPLGPGDAAIEAVRAALRGGGEAGRYPGGAMGLAKAIAEVQGVAPENVVSGCGSTELLRNAVQVYTSKTKPLVTAVPSYEECPQYAELIGSPVRTIPLDANMQIDLNAMAEAAKGAGLVFLNNPNNPTATLHSGDAVADFVARVLKASPDTTILLDEAYHDYVTDPTHRTQIPLAMKDKRVIVARTFSKAHGMAGLRVGYAIGQPDAIRPIAGWNSGSMSIVGITAATQSIADQARLKKEAARNTGVRQYTIDWFKKAGFTATDSQCNFIFVNVKRPAKEFRDACRQNGILVGRDFPPFEKTHARISIGTMEEMHKVTEVFAKVLGVTTIAVAA